jgi:hypothetical protein
MGRLCYPTQASGQSPGTPRQRGPKAVTVQGGYGTCFCSPGTKSAEHYECRGTSYLTNGELSRYCYFVNSCGAVRICQALQSCLGGRSKSKNRDNLSRFFNKKAGNNLPILSVLGFRYLFLLDAFSFVVIRITPFSPALP